ncbi:MAG: hypothetical protein FWD17_03900 [Polyangiaceae bacterium]|nr:hypothetical protein [Polyangiaceae bacterium]
MRSFLGTLTACVGLVSMVACGGGGNLPSNPSNGDGGTGGGGTGGGGTGRDGGIPAEAGASHSSSTSRSASLTSMSTSTASSTTSSSPSFVIPGLDAGGITGDCTDCTNAVACCNAVVALLGQDAGGDAGCDQVSVSACQSATDQQLTIASCQEFVQAGEALGLCP